MQRWQVFSRLCLQGVWWTYPAHHHLPWLGGKRAWRVKNQVDGGYPPARESWWKSSLPREIPACHQSSIDTETSLEEGKRTRAAPFPRRAQQGAGLLWQQWSPLRQRRWGVMTSLMEEVGGEHKWWMNAHYHSCAAFSWRNPSLQQHQISKDGPPWLEREEKGKDMKEC